MKTRFIGGTVGCQLLRYLGRQAARGDHACEARSR